MPIIDDILAGTSGYLEGRAIADVRSIRNIEQMQLRVMWEQLPEEAKQKIIAEQQAQARLVSQRRMAFWGGGLGGIIFLIILVAVTPTSPSRTVSANSSTVSAATSDKSIRDEHPATKSTVSAEDRLKAVCGTTYPSWSRDASNKEVYSCDNGKTWWRK